MEHLVFFAVCGVVLFLLFLREAHNAKKKEKDFVASLYAQYGKFPDKEYSLERFAKIESYWKRHRAADGVDDITWNDLDMELSGMKILLKAMSAVPFSTENYLRERQIAVFEASGFVPKEVKTRKASKKTAAKPQKEKKEDTKVTTFKLYKQGRSIKEIAKERDLNQQTIVRHLAHYVAKGMIDVNELVPESRAESIRDVVSSLGTTKGLAAIKEASPSDVSYQDIVLVIAGMESQS